MPRNKTIAAIHGMFFLSGMGALVFEVVWFNQIGLILGNSVWSAALVIGAFMAGLALGNGAAVLLARRWGNLLRCYGALEAVAAVSGAVAVLAFPHLAAVFRPLLAPFLDHAAILNLSRVAIAFGLMMIPAAALGTTLPLLSKPLEEATGSYGFALGRLYGANTLGAVAGTLLAELVLVPALGLRNSGMVAAACNLGAALIALRVAMAPMLDGVPAVASGARAALPREAGRIVAAASLAGGILLALEVVWFRFLLLFETGTTLMFATMLSVVLAGIGIGGVIAAGGLRRGWPPGTAARLAAAGAAAWGVAGYAAFHVAWEVVVRLHIEPVLRSLLVCVFLMGPASLASGVLFTALGAHLRRRMSGAATTTATLTFANTAGAMAGSLLGAFVLLPVFGVEGSFFALALLYAVAALLIPDGEKAWPRRMAPVVAAALVLALFPFGKMKQVHYSLVERHFGARMVEAREGIVETAFYLAHEFQGQPVYHRLVTNSFSMSGTEIQAQRYMKLFAFLPAALHPRIERALVICFGVGSTASAIADLPDVKLVDVVDVSRNVLEMSDIAHPDPHRHPLKDARVSVHVEDGRFFLQQTDRRYDLITGEPPPPRVAGVAPLYSREYFRLLRDRLNPGGLATYWLPMHQLGESNALSILRAFCDAFEDCSLWSGVGLEWIMMGSRDGIAPVTREGFSRLWTEPQAGKALRRIAIDTPRQLIAQFMADAEVLGQLTERAPPLVDDFPRRIYSAVPLSPAGPLSAALMDAERSRKRLESSAWIAGILPQSLITGNDRLFRQRAMLDQELHPELRGPGYSLWKNLAEVIGRTRLAIWPRWLLKSEVRMAEIAQHADPADPEVAEHLAIDGLATRRRPEKGLTQSRFLAMTPKGQVVTIFRHCLAPERADARTLMTWIPEKRRGQDPYRSFLAWAATECSG